MRVNPQLCEIPAQSSVQVHSFFFSFRKKKLGFVIIYTVVLWYCMFAYKDISPNISGKQVGNTHIMNFSISNLLYLASEAEPQHGAGIDEVHREVCDVCCSKHKLVLDRRHISCSCIASTEVTWIRPCTASQAAMVDFSCDPPKLGFLRVFPPCVSGGSGGRGRRGWGKGFTWPAGHSGGRGLAQFTGA